VVKHSIPFALKILFFWIPWVIKSQGWGLDVPFDKLKGNLMVVFHKDDPTIPFEGSAYKAVKAAKLVFVGVELTQTKEQLLNAEERLIDHHFEPLRNYSTNLSQLADQAIADFILPPTTVENRQIANF
ncbi:MAG: hypothetical protein V4487_02925, partial [Chlamydiota bacterium]